MEEGIVTTHSSDCQMGFTCQICGGTQIFIEGMRIALHVCDDCKKNLKEMVLAHRQNKGEWI